MKSRSAHQLTLTAHMGARLINARLETLASKPTFKAALSHRRCLIPADGFYECQGKSGRKQPFYFHLPCGEPMAFAGLWEVWKPQGAGPGAETYKSSTIITTEASEAVRDIHDRMPLILQPEAFGPWLDPENRDPAQIESLLKAMHVADLDRHQVSRRVNRADNNSAECIKRGVDS